MLLKQNLSSKVEKESWLMHHLVLLLVQALHHHQTNLKQVGKVVRQNLC